MTVKDTLEKAAYRALWTAVEVAIPMIPVGAAIEDVAWLHVLSVVAVAAILSFLKSILVGMPETKTDGTLIVDDTNAETTNYLFQVETPLDEIQTKKSVRMNVEVHK